MKAKDAMICWTPDTDKVGVVPWPDTDRIGDEYERWIGACELNRHKKPTKWKLWCFIDAMHMIVRDKVDPMAVHRAMLQIDEYADGCSDDMPGVHRNYED